ncbi:MAG: hypothetical protein LLG04_08070 [Parachlamydia sp.]|nr:hypothetical protein [Parachlamydia sp.]
MTKFSDKKPDLSKAAKVKKGGSAVDDLTFKKAMKKVLKENKEQLKRLADK